MSTTHKEKVIDSVLTLAQRAQEECANIQSHIRMLIDAEKREELGATDDRDLHIQVMRILCDYNTVREDLEQLRGVLKAANIKIMETHI